MSFVCYCCHAVSELCNACHVSWFYCSAALVAHAAPVSGTSLSMQKWSDHAPVVLDLKGMPEHDTSCLPAPCSLSSRGTPKNSLKAMFQRRAVRPQPQPQPPQAAASAPASQVCPSSERNHRLVERAGGSYSIGSCCFGWLFQLPVASFSASEGEVGTGCTHDIRSKCLWTLKGGSTAQALNQTACATQASERPSHCSKVLT